MTDRRHRIEPTLIRQAMIGAVMGTDSLPALDNCNDIWLDFTGDRFTVWTRAGKRYDVPDFLAGIPFHDGGRDSADLIAYAADIAARRMDRLPVGDLCNERSAYAPH